MSKYLLQSRELVGMVKGYRKCIPTYTKWQTIERFDEKPDPATLHLNTGLKQYRITHQGYSVWRSEW